MNSEDKILLMMRCIEAANSLIKDQKEKYDSESPRLVKVIAQQYFEQAIDAANDPL